MAQELRVLIIEDSEDDALLLARELQRGGFVPKFQRIQTAQALEGALAAEPWDLVISDYSLPKFSGTRALRLVRELGSDLPFIFVSGTISEETAVDAMKAGAHDYIMKGNLKRLVPAVRRELAEAEVRRKREEAENQLRLRDARIRALHEINTAITSTLDLASVLNILLEKIAVPPQYSAATIRLYIKETESLEPVACRNLDLTEWRSKGWAGERDPENIICRDRLPLIIKRLQSDSRVQVSDFYPSQGLVSYLGIPLVAKGEIVGTLGLYAAAERESSGDEIEFLTTLGGQAAVSIQNSRLYEAIKLQAGELERANQVKSDFLSVMSHEFRTPINLMMGYMALVQEGMLGELKAEQSDALKQSLRYSKNLLNLITDLLYANQLQAQNANILVTRVNVGKILDVLRSDLEVSLKENVMLHWHAPLDLPVVETDGDKVKQIVHCLIDNAIKFTEAGTVQVAVRVLQETSSLEIEVADTGTGIPEDQIPLIFDLFRQVDSSSTRSYEGAGLGLYIVKNNTKLLGGDLKVESELGRGSRFRVIIPVRIRSNQ